MLSETKEYEGPAVVDIMGHVKVAGMVRAVELAGPKLRVDVPAVDGHPASTHYFGSQAIFGIHPTTEERVLQLVRTFRYEPASRWDFEQAATPTVETSTSRRIPHGTVFGGDYDPIDIPFGDSDDSRDMEL